MQIDGSKTYEVVNGNTLIAAGTKMKPAKTNDGGLIHGAKTPAMVMFTTSNGGGLFLHPNDVRECG